MVSGSGFDGGSVSVLQSLGLVSGVSGSTARAADGGSLGHQLRV